MTNETACPFFSFFFTLASGVNQAAPFFRSAAIGACDNRSAHTRAKRDADANGENDVEGYVTDRAGRRDAHVRRRRLAERVAALVEEAEARRRRRCRRRVVRRRSQAHLVALQ